MVRALFLIAMTTLASSQAPVPLDYTLNVQVELVQLPVSVVDKNGFPVRGLQQEHFRIYEDKVTQDIAVFKQEDVPVSVALVIDASGSMYHKQDRVNQAALTFVQESNPDDETAIVSFADQPTLAQDFTRNPNTLMNTLNGISVRGDTALHDAVWFAAKHLETSFHEKKVLLVISDGEDNKSIYKLDEVLERIRESKILVYTVGLLSDDSLNGNWPFKAQARRTLEQFAKVTGGRAFFPRNLNAIDEVCKSIAHELRNQYTLAYRPSNPKLDGTWRGVKVQIAATKGMPKMTVRTKQGYYAPLIPVPDAKSAASVK
jgi:Ca-activated chloride channel homolog